MPRSMPTLLRYWRRHMLQVLQAPSQTPRNLQTLSLKLSLNKTALLPRRESRKTKTRILTALVQPVSV
jgi:hypothetical protein